MSKIDIPECNARFFTKNRLKMRASHNTLLEDEGLGVLVTLVGIEVVRRRQCLLAIAIELYSDDDLRCLNQLQWF